MDGADWKQKWQRRLDDAQKVTEFVIKSREYDRIRYGFEEDAMHHAKCDDCGAPRGCFTFSAAILSLVPVVADRQSHAIAFTMKDPARPNQSLEPTAGRCDNQI